MNTVDVWIELPFVVKVTRYFPGDPGRLSGPPEACYPPEPAEVEWHIEKPGGGEWEDILPLMTPDQIEEVTQKVLDELGEE